MDDAEFIFLGGKDFPTATASFHEWHVGGKQNCYDLLKQTIDI